MVPPSHRTMAPLPADAGQPIRSLPTGRTLLQMWHFSLAPSLLRRSTHWVHWAVRTVLLLHLRRLRSTGSDPSRTSQAGRALRREGTSHLLLERQAQCSMFWKADRQRRAMLGTGGPIGRAGLEWNVLSQGGSRSLPVQPGARTEAALFGSVGRGRLSVRMGRAVLAGRVVDLVEKCPIPGRRRMGRAGAADGVDSPADGPTTHQLVERRTEVLVPRSVMMGRRDLTVWWEAAVGPLVRSGRRVGPEVVEEVPGPPTIELEDTGLGRCDPSSW